METPGLCTALSQEELVVHVFPPTQSAVRHPSKLSQRRSTRFGVRDLGPTLALSLATVCSPGVRSLL